MLTGLAYLTQNLFETLTDKSLPEAEMASRIADGIKQTQGKVRTVARGLVPVDVGTEGLMSALSELAAGVQAMHGVTCTFQCDKPVPIADNVTATHLYHIAQEATANALRHADADRILLALQADGDRITLTILDDGVGIDEKAVKHQGLGLRIMHYRADLIGATLDVESRAKGGTLVSCTFPQADRQAGPSVRLPTDAT
jgi:signal transduction histidine kinase